VHIVYLVDQTYKSGGIERVLSAKVNYLLSERSDIQVTIVTNSQHGLPHYFPLHDRVSAIDLDINYDASVSLYSLINIKKALTHLFRLRSVLKNTLPDIVVHCGFGFDYFLLPLVARKSKLIKEFHSSRYQLALRKKKVSEKITDFFEKLYATNVFLSSAEQETSVNKNNVIIPNPVPSVQISGVISKQKQVIAAGRITEVKGFDKLINIWSAIATNYPEWKLKIYGDGDATYIDELIALSNELGCSDSVDILPSTNDIHRHIAEASIYAMSSRTECFPMVLLEAMALKTVVISFDCPTGPKSVLPIGYHSLITDDDNEKYTETLSELISNSDERDKLIQQCYLHQKQFTIDKVMQKWLFLYGAHSD